jgi:hypothetical protein
MVGDPDTTVHKHTLYGVPTLGTLAMAYGPYRTRTASLPHMYSTIPGRTSAGWL